MSLWEPFLFKLPHSGRRITSQGQKESESIGHSAVSKTHAWSVCLYIKLCFVLLATLFFESCMIRRNLIGSQGDLCINYPYLKFPYMHNKLRIFSRIERAIESMPAFMSLVTLVADSHKEIRYQISIQLLLPIKYDISILKYHLIVTDAVGSSLNHHI